MEGWKSGRIENGGRMEKWEDRKDFIFFPSSWEWKSEKMSLNKFTHIPLLKNNVQLKQKSNK